MNWFKRKSYEKSAMNILKALASLENTVRGRPLPQFASPKFILMAQRQLLEAITVWSSLPLNEAFLTCIEAFQDTQPPDEVYAATIRTFQAASAVKGESFYKDFPQDQIDVIEQIDQAYAGRYEVS